MFTIIFIIKTFPQKFEETHGRDFIFTIITSNLVFWVLNKAGESWKFVYCPLRTKNQRMFLHQNSLDRDIMLLVHFMTFLCLLPCRMLMEKRKEEAILKVCIS